MDRHVEALLARLEQSATWPIVWYRGPLFGVDGAPPTTSPSGPKSPSPARSRRADKYGPPRGRPLPHHPVLHRPERPAEGPDRRVAQANQGTPAAELAVTAWDDHQKGLSLTLRQLVAPDWYWYSGPAAYTQVLRSSTTF